MEHDSGPVDPSNAAQADSWDGDSGAYWAEQAETFDRSIAAYQEPLLAAAGIGRADRVLDVGCGNGRTTRDAARQAPGGHALGVDLSAAMLEVARRAATAEGLANVTFAQADAQVHPFAPGAYDLVISRTGAMFFGDPVAAFTNLRRALRPGGRLTLLVWQELAANEWFREFVAALAAPGFAGPPPGAPGPFALSDPDRVRAILAAAGFTGTRLEGRTEPMWFGEDVDAAFRFVVGLAGWMTRDLSDEDRARAHDRLRAGLAAHAGPAGVRYGSATWIVTGAAP